METWWAVDQAFWWGAIGGGVGALLGVGGAVIGGYLVPAGRGHRGVLIGVVAVAIGGLLCAAAGVAAIADGQPYAVFFPLLLVGSVVYWVAVGLLPVFDMAYRSVLREDWRPRGRYGKWVHPLIAAHVAVGLIALLWGASRFLVGATFREWSFGMFIGVGFLFSAGHLWLIKSMAIRGFSRTEELQRLAAEELRRS